MKSKKGFVVLVIAFAVLLVLAGFAYTKLSEKVGEQNNLVASEDKQTQQEITRVEVPDFTVTDWEGNTVNLSDFKGKPVVANFWASWCGPCQMEMPDFEEKYKEYGDDIHFLIINVTDGNRETVETAKTFIQGTDYTFPVYFDTMLDASDKYRVYSLPTTFFFDAEGYGVAQATGMISAEYLQKGIDLIYTP